LIEEPKRLAIKKSTIRNQQSIIDLWLIWCAIPMR
jgi:hypothetical protein